ncbi:MAG: 23S rRNA (adenine(2503)-C2)-methyltransferase, partial [Chloroflexota bacterium]|nr:23S rRNA (adenine(2503)-C2)-methyltransferase [Chloroflexota bacterium]
MSHRVALLDLTYDQLEGMLTDWGEPSYRAAQLWDWLYRSLATDLGEMTNLPMGLKSRLTEATLLEIVKPSAERVSADGLARKVLFGLRDGQAIESVLMLYDKRRTVCASVQVGCAMGCPFCATGQMGFIRDLTPGEIVGQVLYFARQLQADGEGQVTNVV